MPHTKGTGNYPTNPNWLQAKTREGMQYTATAIDKFCAATGILVKPGKSYVNANHEGQAIKINTCKGNTEY